MLGVFLSFPMATSDDTTERAEFLQVFDIICEDILADISHYSLPSEVIPPNVGQRLDNESALLDSPRRQNEQRAYSRIFTLLYF
jgi:hypothetical protein